MKNRFLIVLALLSALFIGVGTAQAATSSLDNLPGGAGFNYFHASASGDVSLLNIQNIDTTAILVHVSLWDSNSDHILDFSVPLSSWDNWGASISGDGTNITVTPQTPCFYSAPNDGCFAPITVAMPAGSDGLQKGYVSYVISAGDSAFYGGDGNGDPRNDPIVTTSSTRHYDVIFGRVALLNVSAGSAIALNGTMLQGFVNIYEAPGLDEDALIPPLLIDEYGYDSISDLAVPFHYNCDGDTNDSFPSRDDIMQGLNIDSWEIFLTRWGDPVSGWQLITDDLDGDGEGEVLYNAVGSASGIYVGRYNEDAAVGSETVLITVFPANAGTLPVASSPPCGYSNRTMLIFTYDDNEFSISTPIISDEVDRLEFDAGGIVVPGTSGEARISVAAPLLGFTYTEVGNYADLYPLIKTDQWIYAGDGLPFWYALDPLESEVIEVGIQETY